MNKVAFNHKPVLLEETLNALGCEKGKIYMDCTAGGGGHSSEILKVIGEEGFLYSLDKDLNAIEKAYEVIKKVGNNFKLIKGSYVDLASIVEENNIPKIDGILFDLGVSSYQLDSPERGFSFSKEASLDMRFDQSDDDTYTALDIINNYHKDDLIKIFFEYGEEPYSKKIAEFIVDYRKKEKITTTTQLSNVVVKALVGKKFVGKVHPATRIFQALRIKVNDELEGIKKVLPIALEKLNPKGRIAVISFHSLEDRIVKETFREFAKACICPSEQPICNCKKKIQGTIISKKPLTASEEEVKVNPRARSAKLRVFEKL